MIPEYEKLLGMLSQTNYGQALKAYLEEKKREIGDISQIQSWEEAKGRQIALKLIRGIFAFLEDKEVNSKTKNPYV